MFNMLGHLEREGVKVAEGGFMHPAVGPRGLEVGPARPLWGQDRPHLSEAATQFMTSLQRAEFVGDISQIAQNLGMTLQELQRGIVSDPYPPFPARENLEAEAKILVPLDTPVRNMLPRVPGAGKASLWRQITSLGGGYGLSGTDVDQPGSTAFTQSFFSETGAPSLTRATVYAAKTAAYKLLGTFGSVTGFAMATGANFQNQYAVEKANSIRNLMLNEEYALIQGNSTSTAFPWGDGVNALAFDGLLNLTTTTNGVPTAQIVSGVGPLTLSHIDNQLRRIWIQGGMSPWILMNGTEILSLVHLAGASGSIIRVMATAQADTILGVAVTGYKHPITGEIVPIYASRFMPAGTIEFGSKFLPDGTPAADVDVLPQVQLPALAPNENVQGYVAQEIAPTATAPQVFGFLVSVYEVLRMKGATVFAKSSGVTPV